MWHCGHHAHESQWAADTCEIMRLRAEKTMLVQSLLVLADTCDEVGIKHFDSDDLSLEATRMQSATKTARSLLAKHL